MVVIFVFVFRFKLLVVKLIEILLEFLLFEFVGVLFVVFENKWYILVKEFLIFENKFLL